MQYLWLILQQPGLSATILEAENIVGGKLEMVGSKDEQDVQKHFMAC